MTEENSLVDDKLEKQLIDVMGQHPKGATNQILQESFPSVAMNQLVKSLNKLLGQKKIQLLSKGKQLVYMLKDSNSNRKIQGSDIEEKIVFEAVERAGTDGIASRDLKYKCNLPQPQITKILKTLESKKIIKCVTSTSKKKLFMLYDLEPNISITGGVFYSGQEFESEFVDVVGEQCYKYLAQAKEAAEKLGDPIAQRNASMKSSKDICDYISSLQISTVKLSVKDIENILEALVYDSKIEKLVSAIGYSSKNESRNLYRISKPLLVGAALMRMPCGVCPVFQDCYVGGEISPSTCVYMKEWLNF